MTHILLVENEIKLARFIELELLSEGYQVSVAHDGLTGLRLAQITTPTIVILDLTLPSLSGLEICYQMRSTGNHMPVIVLTEMNLDEVNKRVIGPEMEADDYLVKPFSMEALLASIQTCLQR